MQRWISQTPPPAPQRWQSRQEILNEYLDSLSPDEMLGSHPYHWALRYGPNGYARKYDPNQPRVPAGNPDGGQWTSEGGSEGITDSRVVSDVTPTNDWMPGAQYAAGRRGPSDRLPPLHHVPSTGVGEVSPYRAGQVTIENNAQTGFSTIDENTEKLRTILEKVVNSRGEGYGPEYGKQIHYDFGDAVKAAIRKGELQGDIKIEHTFPDQEPFRHGSKGTIRTDVVLRNELGEVIAIYDVKTGGAYLDVKRVAQLRAKTSTDLRVPVIEMHTQRGLSLKSHAAKAQYFWFITLRLWNPWYEMVADWEANANGF
jgi:hypothetical protein